MASARLEVPDQRLARLLLESLRRDAYVMEANAYQTPAITESDQAFRRVFAQLYEQLRGLFGTQLTAVVAVDARGAETREVLAGFGQLDVLDISRTSPTSHLGLLAEQNDPVVAIWEFASGVCSSIRQLGSLGDLRNESVVLVAPYLVHSTAVAPPKDYGAQLDTWGSGVGDLMYTRPFQALSPTNQVPSKFADSYYTAVLLLFLPPSAASSELHLDWVEALHIMFQMSWGFPTLGKNLRKIEEMEERETLLKNEADRDNAIRKLTQSVVEKIRGDVRKHTDELLRELAPTYKGLDSQELGRLFVPSKYPLWRDSENQPLLPLHKFEADESEDKSQARALIQFGIFEILQVETPRVPLRDLRARALEAIDIQLGSASNGAQRAFQMLLSRMSEANKHEFFLLRELTLSLSAPDRELPLYAIAARLLLRPVAGEFFVEIRGNTAERIKLTQDNVVAEFDKSVPWGNPNLPKRLLIYGPVVRTGPKGFHHGKWVLPFVDLIGTHLQIRGDQDKVYVASVTMTHLEGDTVIECNLAAKRDEDLKKVLDVLLNSLTQGHGDHDMRLTWLRLQGFPEFLTPSIDYLNRKLVFRVGGSQNAS
jgi:hypothetical protein